MFGLISKRKLLKKLDDLQISNKESIYGYYKEPTTSDQKILNSYNKGYRDGCNDICNCLRELAK